VTFSGDTVLCAGSTINYKTKKEANVTYLWTVTGGKIISGQGTDSLIVKWPYGGAGSIKLKKTNSASSCSDSLKHTVIVGASDISLNDKNAYAIEGNAQWKSGNLYLTDGGSSENSAAWNRNIISLGNSFDFSFNVNQCGSGTGSADGMMFILQNTDTTAMGGTTNQGSALAYYDAASGVMDQSLGIEMDIYQSTTATWADSSDSHIALVKNKSVTPLIKQVNITSPKLQSCSTQTFRVVWNVQTKQLSVYYAGSKVFTYTNDIVNNIFNGNPFVYFGFTGATGGVTSTQYFSNDTLIYAKPIITYNKPLNFCGNDSVTLTASGGAAYLWNTGARTQKITVKKSGYYKVTVTDVTGCSHISDSVSLKANPLPAVELGPDVHTCHGSGITIGVTSNSQYAYYLYSKDGSYASSKSQDIVKPDSTTWFYLNVRDRNTNCSSTDSMRVIVDPGPNVGFSAANACLGTPTVFANTSKGKLSYFWNFGDGTTSTATVPSKTYAKPGVYQIVLTAKNDSSGCIDSFIGKATVLSKPVAGFNSTDVCTGNTMNFYNASSAGTGSIKTLTWDFGDGTTSAATNPTKKYTKPGTYTVKIRVENSYGCLDSTTKSVTIYPKPKAAFTVFSGCINSPVSFNDSSKVDPPYTIQTRNWDFGDGGTSQLLAPDHLYKKPGTYTVKLVVGNNHGCVDTAIQKITVTALPRALFSVSDVCVSDAASPVDASTADTPSRINKWHWRMGDGTTDTSATPKHYYSNPGQYTIWLTVTTADGCQDSVGKTVKVYPLPDADFTNRASGRKISFMPDDTNQASYAWDLGDGTTSTEKKPSRLYAKDTLHIVKLTVTNTYGCTKTTTDTVGRKTGIAEPSEGNNLTVYPNPFTNEFTVSYTLTQRSDVVTTVIDMNGKELIRKTDYRLPSGVNSFSLKGSALTPGIYLLRVTTSDGVFTREIMKM
jgi:PKD repeat protein